MRVGQQWITSRLAALDRRVTLGLGVVVTGAIYTAAVFFLGARGGMIAAGWLALAGGALAYRRLSAKAAAATAALTAASASEHIATTRQVQSLLYVLSVVKPALPLPPMRDMAISPDFAATLVSIVMESRPTTILEFGSGTSTLLCGYCLKHLGGGTVISVNHDQKYADQTMEAVREHGLAAFARVEHAPLRTLSLPAGSWQWYDTAFLARVPAVDLLIVDGPPRWLQRLARYPALPITIGKLGPAATILIDDARRPDEQEMVGRWVFEFPGFRRFNLDHEKGTIVLRRLPRGVCT